MIVLLSGYAGVGKDTVADILVERFGFEKQAFTDIINPLLLRVDSSVGHVINCDFDGDWEKAKREVPWVREQQQNLAEAIHDIMGPLALCEALRSRWHPGKDYVITNGRRWEQAEFIHACGGWVIRIERPGVGPANDHVSETELDDYLFDMTWVNDGRLVDLRNQVTGAWNDHLLTPN